MSVELEAKIRVNDLEPVRRRLRESGGSYRGRVLETNYLLDREDWSLRNAGCGLRVRGVAVLEGDGPGPTMTFKGPKQAGAFKQREEFESSVSDPEATLEILRGLGFSREFVFEKRRETWRLGGCTIELDELPRLGAFVEVEGPDVAAIEAVLAQLGLDASESITDAYVSMLAATMTDENSPRVEIRF